MKIPNIWGNVLPAIMIIVTYIGCNEPPQAGWVDAERLAAADGMATFADVLSMEDVDAIQVHLISLQRERFDSQPE